MKKLALVVLLVLGLTLEVAAQSIHIEWGYTPPSTPAVTGFKVYQNGVFACQTTDPNATAMDCNVVFTTINTPFTLTATFSDGTESPHSSPFLFANQTACVNPITVTQNIFGQVIDYADCAGVTEYEVKIKNQSGAIVQSFNTINSQTPSLSLPTGNYTVEIKPVGGAITVTKEFTTVSFTPPPPQVAGRTKLGSTKVLSLTAKSPDPNVTEYRYEVYARNATDNAITFIPSGTGNGSFVYPAGAGNWVRDLTTSLTNKRGLIIYVRAYNSLYGTLSEPTIYVEQFGDLNKDKVVTSTDQTALLAQNAKTAAPWNPATRDWVAYPITAFELADQDNNGAVNTTVDLILMRAFLKASPNPMAVTPLAP